MTTESISAATDSDSTVDDTEILQLFHDWNEALTERSATRVAALYRPDAVLVPTLSDTLRSTPEQILAYFEKLIDEEAPTVMLSTTVLIKRFGTTAINSGLYTFHLRNSGEYAGARYTFAYYWSDGGWRISAHHSSLLYGAIVAGKANRAPNF